MTMEMSALHIAATLKASNDEIHLLTNMLQVLFDGGAHHDFVNNDGKTWLELMKLAWFFLRGENWS